MSGRVFRLTLRKQFVISINASTWLWLTSTPTLHCWLDRPPPPPSNGENPSRSPERQWQQRGDLSCLQQLHLQCREDAHRQPQPRVRRWFLWSLCVCVWGGNIEALAKCLSGALRTWMSLGRGHGKRALTAGPAEKPQKRWGFPAKQIMSWKKSRYKGVSTSVCLC